MRNIGIQHFDNFDPFSLLFNAYGRSNQITLSNLQVFFKSLSQNSLKVYISYYKNRDLCNRSHYYSNNINRVHNDDSTIKPSESSQILSNNDLTCYLNKDMPSVWIFLLSNLSKERYLQVSPQFFQLLSLINFSSVLTYNHIYFPLKLSDIQSPTFFESVRTILENEKVSKKHSSSTPSENNKKHTHIKYLPRCAASAPISLQHKTQRPISDFMKQKRILNQKTKPSLRSNFSLNISAITKESKEINLSFSKSYTLTSIPNDKELFSVTPELYFSGEAAALNYSKLLEYKITHIISLNPLSIHFPNQFEYYQLNLRDSPFEELPPQFWEFPSKIEKIIKSGGRVLVHCRRGFSRSPSLCILYLMDIKKLSFSDSYAKIKQIQPMLQINNGYLQQLSDHEKS